MSETHLVQCHRGRTLRMWISMIGEGIALVSHSQGREPHPDYLAYLDEAAAVELMDHLEERTYLDTADYTLHIGDSYVTEEAIANLDINGHGTSMNQDNVDELKDKLWRAIQDLLKQEKT